MSNLKKQVALSSDLCFAESRMVVELGANQNLRQEYPATVANNNGITFTNILALGQNSVISSQMQIQYQLSVNFDVSQGQIPPGVQVTFGANPAGCAAVIDPNPFVPFVSTDGTITNIPNLFFRKLPMSSVSTAALQLNSVETTVNLALNLASNSAWAIDDVAASKWCSGCPNMDAKGVLNASPVYIDTTNLVAGGPLHAWAPTTTSSDSLGAPYAVNKKSNAAWLPVSISAGGGAGQFVAVYQFTEPVLVSPLTYKDGAPALCNVQNFQLKYTFDNSQNLTGMLVAGDQFVNATKQLIPVGYAGGKLSLTNLKVAFSSVDNTKLYVDTLSVDEAISGRIPEIAHYDYHYIENNQTSLSLVDAIANPADRTSTTAAFRLATLPKYWICHIAPQYQSLVPTNNLTGFRIKNIQVQLGNLGQYFLRQQDLYNCFVKNTGLISITQQEWIFMGCPLILDVATDLSSSQGMFSGIENTGGLSWNVSITYDNYPYTVGGTAITANYSNLTGATNAGQFYIYEMFVLQGVCSIGQGSCVYKSSTMSEAEFLDRVDKDGFVSNEHLAATVGGGSLFGKLKSVFNTAHQVLKTGAQAIQHPIVQKGLSMLAGSGMSAGSMRHRK